MHHLETFRRYLLVCPVVPAPMCGYSDRPFRDLLRSTGARLVYTEMVSSEAMVRGDPKTWQLMDFRGEEPPVAVQLFGSRADVLAESARIAVRAGAAVIDLNCGCPARKVVNSDCGAALLDDPKGLAAICRAIRRAVDVPFTIKVRWVAEGERTLEIARLCEAEGIDAIALHARTRKQGYSGTARWEWIAELKRTVSIPVIGNGDVTTADDYFRMRRETGCDGVMVGRGMVGNPWLIGEILGLIESPGEVGEFHDPSPAERLRLLRLHANLMYKHRGAHGLVEFRKHCVGYLKGLPGARVARPELMQATTLEQIDEILGRHFSDLG
jgi:tRNA-dihydrouridine synthase B